MLSNYNFDPYFQLKEGKLFSTEGTLTYYNGVDFSIMYPDILIEVVILSRTPRPIDKIYNLLMPFQPLIWFLFILCAFIFGIMFCVVHHIYASKALTHYKLHVDEQHVSNFFIFSLAKITEPDPITWFARKAIAGNIVLLTWSFFSLMVTFFYCSNLLAHLSALSFEDRIDTLQDVVNNGQRPYIMREMTEFSLDFLERNGKEGTVLHQIASLATRLGGYYNLADQRRIPEERLLDVLENKAVMTLTKNTLPLFRAHPAYKGILDGDRLYPAKEFPLTFMKCLILRKHSPIRQKVSETIMIAVEMGMSKRWEREFLSSESFIEFSEKKLQEETERKAMEFLQLWPAVIFVAIGLCFSFVVLAFEFIKIKLSFDCSNEDGTVKSLSHTYS